MDQMVLFFLVFTSVFLVVLSLSQGSRQKKQEAEKRLHQAIAQQRSENNFSVVQDAGQQTGNQAQKLLRRVSVIFARNKASKKIERQLAMSDIPLKGEEFTVIVFVSAILTFFLVLVLSENLATGVLFSTIGASLPYLYVKRAGAIRLKKFDAQITDAITVLTNSLRSGYSFLQSLDMVRKELPSPLKKELARTIREINLGIRVEDALTNLAQRSNSQDMDMIVTAVLIQRQVGGNLAEILDNINETINERIRIRGEIRTLTAQGRISGFIIGLLPFALAAILFIINADYMMALFENTLGLCMISVALVMELVGFLMIKRIINIEV